MILQQLSEAIGVSGQEEAVRQIILEAIAGHVEDIRIDPLGSITAIKKGNGKKLPRVMIAAHMDEVGFMVTGFESNGLLRFVNVGGVDARILPGLRVKVGKDWLPGVIIWPPIHKNQDQATQDIDKLRIDIGAASKDEAQGKVKRGDPVAFDSRFMEIGATWLRGKAFDDRVGCSLLVDVLQGGPYPVDIWAAFTVQEEVGLRGARVAAQTLSPDMAFVLEGTTAHDLPNPLADPDDEETVNPACRIGQGPVLTVMDRTMIADPRLLNFLRQIGETQGIPYQLKTLAVGGTDAGAIQVTGRGVPAAVIAMPCRYIHSPTAYLSTEDYANALKLLQAALNQVTFATLSH